MKKLLASLGVFVAVVAGTTAVSFAAIPDTSGNIHSCYNNGLLPTLRIINSSSQSCGLGETSLNWAQDGGAYTIVGTTDTLTTDSGGLIVHVPVSDFTATCNTGDYAMQGVFTTSGANAAAVFGTGVTRVGDSASASGMTTNIGTFTVGFNLGVANVNATLKYYAVCLPVPTLPS